MNLYDQPISITAQWEAFNKVLNWINEQEEKMISKGDLYDAVMDMRPDYLNLQHTMEGENMILNEHMKRQMAFSRATFGPGERMEGVIDHIRKELKEIQVNPDDGVRSKEWVDVVLLSLDGLWRALYSEGEEWEDIPYVIGEMVEFKQSKNEQRDWPDWRTQPLDKAIGHIKDNTEIARIHAFEKDDK